MACDINPEIITRLVDARSVVVLTGAGVATESGVPTFRESQVGEWADYDPSELATAQAFLRNPRRVWDWYEFRRKHIEETVPSAVHYALVDLEQLYDDFALITQNIDGLHWRAGSRALVELHGNIGRIRCFDCGSHDAAWDEEGDRPPICVRCGGLLRPDVVWLGEGFSAHDLRRCYNASERAQVFLSIGTSAEVRPAASLPLIAKRAGAFVVEINPMETALAVMADLWISEPIGEVLPVLVSRVQEHFEAREEGA
jgi:NAD-dependent deacetylase